MGQTKCVNALISLTADGWSKRLSEVIGVTAHWIHEYWTTGCAYYDLIDIQSHSATREITTQDVFNAFRERFPETERILVMKADNSDPASLIEEVFSAFSGNGRILHMPSLSFKQYFLKFRPRFDLFMRRFTKFGICKPLWYVLSLYGTCKDSNRKWNYRKTCSATKRIERNSWYLT